MVPLRMAGYVCLTGFCLRGSVRGFFYFILQFRSNVSDGTVFSKRTGRMPTVHWKSTGLSSSLFTFSGKGVKSVRWKVKEFIEGFHRNVRNVYIPFVD